MPLTTKLIDVNLPQDQFDPNADGLQALQAKFDDKIIHVSLSINTQDNLTKAIVIEKMAAIVTAYQEGRTTEFIDIYRLLTTTKAQVIERQGS